MTFRTLLLDKLLTQFFTFLMGPLEENVSMGRLLELFERSGGCVETNSKWEYWIDSGGLSKQNGILLKQIISRLNEMSLTNQGKPIQIRLKEGFG